MAGPWPTAIKSKPGRRLVLIVPVSGQKVKYVSPSALEISLGSREQEPAGSANRTAIAAGFRHDVDTRL